MRQSIITVLLTVFMSMVCTRVSAYDFTAKNADGVEIYYLKKDNTKLEVCGLNRNQTFSGELVIPNVVEYKGITYNVTSIGNEAFRECSCLTSVIIPNTIESIGQLAFAYCNNIKAINIPQGITRIELGTFNGCTSLSSIKIPKSITYIGMGAFKDCCFDKVIIEDLSAWFNIQLDVVTHYDEWADYSNYSANPFYNSSHLYKDENTEITTLEIPEGTTEISEALFCGCSGLKEIKIPNSLEKIGVRAFYKCSGLTSITIPKNVTNVVSNAFEGCNGLIYVELHCKSTPSFSGNTSIKNVIIGDEVEYICWNAFSGCTGLSSLSIPNSVKNIGNEAFKGCVGLTSVNIPDKVTSIEPGTFAGCTGLTSITIPNGVTSIGKNAFEDCTALASISIPTSVTSVGVDAFSGSAWYNNQSDGLIYIGGIAYEYKGIMPDNTIIIIKEGTKIINANTFQECTGLTAITIPNSVTTIGNYAFYKCSGLISVTIPGSVKSIGQWAFSYCSKLKSLTIQYGVNLIDEEAFSGCTSLESVTIPNSVTSDLYYTFSGCSSLKNITISNKVKILGHDVFKDCVSLESIDIPNSVTEIYGAFKGCTSLSSIIIPNNVTSIGRYAFSGCTNLSSAKLGNSLKSIDKYAFENTSLTSIAIPNLVSEISEGAFMNCSNLKSARIGDGVEKIRKNAFSGCSSLETVWFGTSLKNIYDTSFDYCSNIKHAIITSQDFPTFAAKTQTGRPATYNITGMFIMKQSTYNAGIPSYVKTFATYSDSPMIIEVKSKSATSAVFELYTINDDGSLDEKNVVTVTTTGQTPGQYLNWKKDKNNYGILSDKANETIILTVQEPKALSTKKARLLADVEEADDVEHFGFEWRRYDAPDGIPSSKVSAPLFNGKIVGTLSNLKDDVYYKYRPFYKSDAGETYYGEWMGLFTGDADVFFEPEVYTKDATDITKVSALLAGIWIEGTEDIEEKGFEYWTIPGSKTRAVGSNVQTVIVSGKNLTSTVEGLKSGTEYGFRSYIKTASGTTYGEEKSFKTILVGDVNGDGVLDKKDLKDLTDHIMGNTPADFNIKKADINEDTKVNAADLVILVNLINLAQ